MRLPPHEGPLRRPFDSPQAVYQIGKTISGSWGVGTGKLPKSAEMHTIGQEQHHAIIEAIENGQGTRAEAVAREHARLSRRNLETVLTDSEILSCVPGNSLIKT